MSAPETQNQQPYGSLETGAQEPTARSGVKIETNSKGKAQLKVQTYEGTTEAEMQRVLDLAIATYEAGLRSLGALAQF